MFVEDADGDWLVWKVRTEDGKVRRMYEQMTPAMIHEWDLKRLEQGDDSTDDDEDAQDQTASEQEEDLEMDLDIVQESKTPNELAEDALRDAKIKTAAQLPAESVKKNPKKQ